MTDDPPRVRSIHVATARRLPTRTVPEVEAEEGRGLVGDRYHGTKHRHVTIQSSDDLAAASAQLGQEIDPGLTRRNVTLTHGDLPTRPGALLRIGDVELQVVRPAAPCRLLDDWIAPGAMRSLHGRGGVVCRLLSSGTIRVGDAVTWPAPEGAAADGPPDRSSGGQGTSR
ncbi:MOSC domain-containing protein [Cellulosimicrobium marinum]|uniref:MOSC domain-containing protein n=1 Tax=Cellulosimicrobium marinum TaxID=1638992 RepID=UPI001E5346F3|nr:MOSC domain-containing protein [Cellulosimicrobium marinum]MCB7136211.1 MOSC domain-containing protein [Cellulosimicrobium marinum]